MDTNEKLARLGQKYLFFTDHPELSPGAVSDSMDVSGMDVDFESPTIKEFPIREERWAEMDRRRIRAIVRKLRDAGLPIEKQAFGDDGIKILARVNEHLVLTAYAYGTCTMVDTAETERVEVLEIPDNIKEAYTVTKVVPKQKRVCAPLLKPSEIEAL